MAVCVEASQIYAADLGRHHVAYVNTLRTETFFNVLVVCRSLMALYQDTGQMQMVRPLLLEARGYEGDVACSDRSL